MECEQAVSSKEELKTACSQHVEALRSCEQELSALKAVHDELSCCIRSVQAEHSSTLQRVTDTAQREERASVLVQQLQAELGHTKDLLAAARDELAAAKARLTDEPGPGVAGESGSLTVPPSPFPDRSAEVALLHSRVQQLTADLSAAHSMCEQLKEAAAAFKQAQSVVPSAVAASLAVPAGTAETAAEEAALAPLEGPSLLKGSSVTSVRARTAVASGFGSSPGRCALDIHQHPCDGVFEYTSRSTCFR